MQTRIRGGSSPSEETSIRTPTVNSSWEALSKTGRRIRAIISLKKSLSDLVLRERTSVNPFQDPRFVGTLHTNSNNQANVEGTTVARDRNTY